MTEALIWLLGAVIIAGILVVLAQKIIAIIPMDGGFKEIALWIIYLIAALIIFSKAMPVILALVH